MPVDVETVTSWSDTPDVLVIANETTSEVKLQQDGLTITLDYSQIGGVAQQLGYLMIHLPIPGCKPANQPSVEVNDGSAG